MGGGGGGIRPPGLRSAKNSPAWIGLNRYVLSMVLKVSILGALGSVSGSSFQSLGIAIENALSLYVTVLDLGILRSSCERDRSNRTLQR